MNEGSRKNTCPTLEENQKDVEYKYRRYDYKGWALRGTTNFPWRWNAVKLNKRARRRCPSGPGRVGFTRGPAWAWAKV